MPPQTTDERHVHGRAFAGHAVRARRDRRDASGRNPISDPDPDPDRDRRVGRAGHLVCTSPRWRRPPTLTRRSISARPFAVLAGAGITTFKTGTDFQGTVMAYTATITAQQGATFVGRLLMRDSAVTVNNNTISRPSCVVSPDEETDGDGEGTGEPTTPADWRHRWHGRDRRDGSAERRRPGG